MSSISYGRLPELWKVSFDLYYAITEQFKTFVLVPVEDYNTIRSNILQSINWLEEVSGTLWPAGPETDNFIIQIEQALMALKSIANIMPSGGRAPGPPTTPI